MSTSRYSIILDIQKEINWIGVSSLMYTSAFISLPNSTHPYHHIYSLGAYASTSISTLISSSPNLVTPTHVQSGAWFGIHFLKLFTMIYSASLFNGIWYERTLYTACHPFLTPAARSSASTLRKAWSICSIVSRKISCGGSGFQPPVVRLKKC